MKPITPEEWEIYVSELTPEQLWSKTRAMNNINFIRMLESEGMTADDIEGIFKIFADRFTALGLEPPTGGYVDLLSV